jgi:hypothetical protein
MNHYLFWFLIDDITGQYVVHFLQVKRRTDNSTSCLFLQTLFLMSCRKREARKHEQKTRANCQMKAKAPVQYSRPARAQPATTSWLPSPSPEAAAVVLRLSARTSGRSARRGRAAPRARAESGPPSPRAGCGPGSSPSLPAGAPRRRRPPEYHLKHDSNSIGLAMRSGRSKRTSEGQGRSRPAAI